MGKKTDFWSALFPGSIRAHDHDSRHGTNYSGSYPENDPQKPGDSVSTLRAKHDALDRAPVLAGDGFRARDKLKKEIGRRTGSPCARTDPIGFFREHGRWGTPSDW